MRIGGFTGQLVWLTINLLRNIGISRPASIPDDYLSVEVCDISSGVVHWNNSQGFQRGVLEVKKSDGFLFNCWHSFLLSFFFFLLHLYHGYKQKDSFLSASFSKRSL